MKWEYTTFTKHIGADPEDDLNMFGDDEWELVAVVWDSDGVRYILKRKAEE
jgi:hypothetical protein